MIDVTTNIKIIVQAKLDQIKALKNNPDPILRTVALTVLPAMKERVHIQGKDSKGAQIGTYSPEYMVLRTGAFKNADRVSRGVNQGKLKNSGTFTEKKIYLNKKVGVFYGEDLVGKARPNYHRTADTKVILSLTRQMENDMTVVPTESGYGIGYNNQLNLKKAFWCEETYKKPILSQLSTEELELVGNTARNFLPEYLKTV